MVEPGDRKRPRGKPGAKRTGEKTIKKFIPGRGVIQVREQRRDRRATDEDSSPTIPTYWPQTTPDGFDNPTASQTALGDLERYNKTIATITARGGMIGHVDPQDVLFVLFHRELGTLDLPTVKSLYRALLSVASERIRLTKHHFNALLAHLLEPATVGPEYGPTVSADVQEFVQELVADMQSLDISVRSETYSWLIVAAESKSPEAVKALWKEATEKGMKINVHGCNVLLRCHAGPPDTPSSPSSPASASLPFALGLGLDDDSAATTDTPSRSHAWELFTHLKTYSEPNVNTFEALLRIFTKNRDYKRVRKVMNKLYASKLQWRIRTTYPTVLEAIAECGDQTMFQSVLKRIRIGQVIPNRPMMNAIMRFGINNGTPQDAIRIWASHKHRIPPDHTTYTLLLEACSMPGWESGDPDVGPYILRRYYLENTDTPHRVGEDILRDVVMPKLRNDVWMGKHRVGPRTWEMCVPALARVGATLEEVWGVWEELRTRMVERWCELGVYGYGESDEVKGGVERGDVVVVGLQDTIHDNTPTDADASSVQFPHLEQPPTTTTTSMMQTSLEDHLSLLGTLNICALRAHAIHTLADDTMATNPEEALSLYLHALGLYQLGMEVARTVWDRSMGSSHNHGNGNGGGGKELGVLSVAVQWIRERFNECLERAEGVRVDEGAGAGAGAGAGEGEGEARCVEKVVYDRALELARWAAQTELEGTDLPACEAAYQQSILLLEALLHSPDPPPPPSASSSFADDTPEGVGDGMSDEDRGVIERFVASLYGRVAGVQAKMKDAGAGAGGA
ncbi:Serine/threonine-protein kinase [Borealophlyctis nickersoniae]|nr:Serine/threonine-protein kinase [Borealophlyctis nickersoniae]